jgi:hypothetical protein
MGGSKKTRVDRDVEQRNGLESGTGQALSPKQDGVSPLDFSISLQLRIWGMVTAIVWMSLGSSENLEACR